MIDLHLSAFTPRWSFLYAVRIYAYVKKRKFPDSSFMTHFISLFYYHSRKIQEWRYYLKYYIAKSGIWNSMYFCCYSNKIQNGILHEIRLVREELWQISFRYRGLDLRRSPRMLDTGLIKIR